MNLTRASEDTVPDVLAALAPGGPGFVASSWSGELTAVPEPATALALGLGLAAVAVARRR